jgi:hypothetical protein
MLAGAALWLFCSSVSLVESLIMFDCDIRNSTDLSDTEGVD